LRIVSAWPDLWSSALPAHDPDRRSALVTLQAELFVNARARDLETIRAFEAMILGFLPRMDVATLTAVAGLVGACPDTPETVLVALAQRSADARAVLAARAPHLPEDVVDLLLATPRDRPSLAARPDLDAHTLERLLVVNEEAVDAALAANPAVTHAFPGFALLVERAQERPLLAARLLARDDLTLADEAALYLQADPARKAEIRHRVAASAVFQRPQSPPRVAGAAVDDLLALARGGEVTAFEGELAAALNLPRTTAWRFAEADRHELLALALLALGLPEDDAVRVFLTLHPAIAQSVPTVFALARVVRQVARPTALALVEAALGARVEAERTGRHVPAWDASGTPARATGLPASDQRRAVPSEPRQRAG
jgi:hypothetical protein